MRQTLPYYYYVLLWFVTLISLCSGGCCWNFECAVCLNMSKEDMTISCGALMNMSR